MLLNSHPELIYCRFYQAAEASNTTAAGYSAFFDAHSTIELAGWDPSQDVKDGMIVREVRQSQHFGDSRVPETIDFGEM